MAWKVPIIAQSTLSLCWEACGQMLWQWRNQNNPNLLNGYTKKAGKYAQMNMGLPEQQMDAFYRQLGIRSLKNASGKNIRHALKWTPVIVTLQGQGAGHAIVITEYNNRKYKIINPCGIQAVDFSNPSSNSCNATVILLPKSEIDNQLGQYIWYW